MTDDDYIRKGIEFARGWDLTENQLTLPSGHYFAVNCSADFRDWMLDALAAQLVRQVDATRTFYVEQLPWDTCVNKENGEALSAYGDPENSERTMNTIKAIVDSGVLEKSE